MDGEFFYLRVSHDLFNQFPYLGLELYPDFVFIQFLGQSLNFILASSDIVQSINFASKCSPDKLKVLAAPFLNKMLK